MLDYIAKREVTTKCGEEFRECKNRAACHVPEVLHERQILAGKSCDKVFAAAWIDDVNVALGTKDNRFMLVDTQTGRTVEITLPRRGLSASPVPSSGIHSISINLSKSLLATGADNPNDVAVFKLPSFRPVRVLKKHDDWIFSTSWLTDTVLATGSRDSTVKLWSVNKSGSFVSESPMVERRYHKSQVRDIKYCKGSERLVTISKDGTCKIWDPHVMEVVTSVEMHFKNDLTCLALEYPVLAVGSEKHVSFIDMRCGHLTKHVPSLDEGWGVRSLSFRGPLLTCGGGKGRLSFYDLRATKYIVLDPEHTTKRKRLYYSTGNDVQELNTIARTEQQFNSVYAHCYDVTGTRLLTVGGPALYGQKGCYVAVW